MKTPILFLPIFLILFTVSCTKEDVPPKYDPEEIVVEIETSNGFFANKAFLVIQNQETEPVYRELIRGESYTIRRGDSIKGESINLHFVYNIFDDDGQVSSYYSVEPGKKIFLDSGNYPKALNEPEAGVKNSVVNISFSDVPDFNIATRTAMHSLHSHTQNTLEVPCANVGGNAIPVGLPFYVCLHSGASASYKLLYMPSASEISISLQDLNPNMTKYSILKNDDYPLSVRVNAYGSAGGISIFNLSPNDNLLYPGNQIDVFVPKEISEMSTFNTTFRMYKEKSHTHSSYYNHNQIITNYSFLDANFSLTRSMGEIPAISVSGDEYHYVSIEMAPLIDDVYFHWYITAPNPNALQKFSFPEQVLEILPEFFSDFFSQQLGISVSINTDSRLNSYDDVVNNLLNIHKPDETGQYTISTATFNWKDNE